MTAGRELRTRGSDGEDAADVLAHLARRHSVGPKHLAPPAPSAADWARIAVLAQRAPDHGGLRPFRLAVVADDQRGQLADLFAAGAAARGGDARAVEQARERAHNGPGLAALIARVRDDVELVPATEQWVAVGGALMNVLNALHLLGYAAKTLSGPSVRDAAVHAAFCGPGETLVAWIAVGTPTRASHPREPADDPAIVAPWQPYAAAAGGAAQRLPTLACNARPSLPVADDGSDPVRRDGR